MRYVWYMVRRFFRRTFARMRARPRTALLGTGAALVLMYFLWIAPAFSFPVGAYVSIPAGSSLSESAEILQDRGVIHSPFFFKLFVYLFGGEKRLVAGEYFFPEKQTVITIAYRMTNGDFEVDPARIRVPEGATVAEIADLLEKNIPDFDKTEFLSKAQGKEGYLFPDTYFIMPGQSVDSILGAFASNFNKNVYKIQNKIEAFGRPLSDVIIMASLLEREAPYTDDRRVIAGILWKRMKLGMPLQVDAVFPYIIGKNSYTLTRADLKTDSPYNTYTNTGLPPGPIANPSLDAILAAVTPIQTNYLYYLSDYGGHFHYSATYEQHLTAKARYIDNM